MLYGSPWSEGFVRDLSEKEFRDEFVADQIRTRIALLIRALREQSDRNWSQTHLANEMGKPQSVVSRLEDPDYGKMTLQTLFDVAAAFDLPLWVDIPEWEKWLRLIRDVPNAKTSRKSFDENYLSSLSKDRIKNIFPTGGNVVSLSSRSGATTAARIGYAGSSLTRFVA